MQKTYKTNRLIISQVQLTDTEALMAVFEDRQIELLSGLLLPSNPIQRYMAFQMMCSKPYIYVMRQLASNELVGVVGFYPCYLRDEMPAIDDREIGYALKKNQWNQGLMTEACGPLVQDFIADDPQHTVHANVLPRNFRSIRVLQKNGFDVTPVPNYLTVDDDEEKIHLQRGAQK